jgi:protein-serine/threonine kinase
MPSASFNSYPTSPSLSYSSSGQNSPRPSTWKSIFRMPSASFKKASNGMNGVSSARLDADCLSYSAFSSVTHTPLTPNHSMSAASFFPEPRMSYNSSNSHSTDSFTGLNFKDSPLRTPQHYLFPRSQHPTSSDPPTSTPRLRQHAMSTAGKLRPPVKQIPQAISADPSQSSFSRAHPTRAKTNVPLSPKSVTASASRFLRRVASAPNAKGLFSMGMRSTSSFTKNGWVAPNDSVPPLPPLTSSETEQGQDSLETVSSTSSRGVRMTPSRRVSPRPAPLNPKFQQGLIPPNRAAFRRTYSSNSIKVRQVRY